MLLGADTWLCADNSLAYYNTPWYLCSSEITSCPNPTWTLSQDGLSCFRPNPSCSFDHTSVSEIKLLAAIVYAEASVNSNFEEKAAIANAVIRFRDSYGYNSVNTLISKRKTYSAAVLNKVVRYRLVMCSDVAIEYPEVYSAVLNALDPNGTDYANGGCFGDGNDLKIVGSKLYHYKKDISL